MEEKERQKLEEETKKLLDKFSNALESVKLDKGEEWNVERESDRRKEGEEKVAVIDYPSLKV